MATCAIAGNHRRRATEFGEAGHPLDSGQPILNGSRPPVLGRPAVIDGDHLRVASDGQTPARPVVGLDIYRSSTSHRER